jgi:hypothetical protein
MRGGGGQQDDVAGDRRRLLPSVHYGLRWQFDRVGLDLILKRDLDAETAIRRYVEWQGKEEVTHAEHISTKYALVRGVRRPRVYPGASPRTPPELTWS